MAVREQRAAQTPVAELKEEREGTHVISPEETPYLPAHVAGHQSRGYSPRGSRPLVREPEARPSS
jgi:hypothetical protein